MSYHQHLGTTMEIRVCTFCVIPGVGVHVIVLVLMFVLYYLSLHVVILQCMYIMPNISCNAYLIKLIIEEKKINISFSIGCI